MHIWVQTRRREAIAALACLVVVLASPAALAQRYDFNTQPVEPPNRGKDHSLWVPPVEQTPVIHGVLWYWPGSGGDTRGSVENPQFQNAARAMGFALMGVRGNFGIDYTGGQTAQSILENALGMAADVSGRSEIANAPLALHGYSAGGYDVTKAVIEAPSLVLGAAGYMGFRQPPYQSGVGFVLPDAAAATPTLAVAGSNDGTIEPGELQREWRRWRVDNAAQTAFAVDWNVGHNDSAGQARELGLFFLAESAKRRTPQSWDPLAARPVLSSIEDGAFLGQMPEFDNSLVGGDNSAVLESSPFAMIEPEDTAIGDLTDRTWLPSEAAAMAYRAVTSFDGNTGRFEGPRNGPLQFESPTAFELIETGQPITLTLDTRELTQVQRIVVYDGADPLGDAIWNGQRWTFTHSFSDAGLHGLVAVASQTGGAMTSAFRAVAVVPEPASGGVTALSVLLLLARHRTRR